MWKKYLVNKSRKLEACINNVDLCSCIVRATTGPHKDITNVHKKGNKSYKPPPILEKVSQETNQAPILLQKFTCLHVK
jgi:hypothetical protein